MGVAYLEFRGENFRGWLKNREIRESFLPRKFPAIRYLYWKTEEQLGDTAIYYHHLVTNINVSRYVHTLPGSI